MCVCVCVCVAIAFGLLLQFLSTDQQTRGNQGHSKSACEV